MFRRAASAPAWWNVTKTLIQSIMLWTVALGLCPVAIASGTRGFADGALEFAPWPRTGWTMFALASAAGLWSGWIMATFGRGTPLPLDHAREMVTSGPYAVVRNPMAIFGLGQGLGVGLVLGSWPVLAYVGAGGAFWNWVLRPLEERRLSEQFGDRYEQYRREVRCWIPRPRRYRIAGISEDR